VGLPGTLVSEPSDQVHGQPALFALTDESQVRTWVCCCVCDHGGGAGDPGLKRRARG
jgi:hypothetical protein